MKTQSFNISPPGTQNGGQTVAELTLTSVCTHTSAIGNKIYSLIKNSLILSQNVMAYNKNDGKSVKNSL